MATLGRIIFTISIQKSEKQRKVLRVFWKNLPMKGPSSTLGTTLGQIFPENPSRFSTVYTRPAAGNDILFVGKY